MEKNIVAGFFIFVALTGDFSSAQEPTCPPLTPNMGVVVKCKSAEKSSYSSSDCANELTMGSEAIYSCKRYYVNADGDDIGGKLICGEDGKWSRASIFDRFFCSLECGLPVNSTLNTISSFIENDGQFFFEGEIFPWHVAIFRSFGGPNSRKFVCGGTLVNPLNRGFLILTSAHCLTKSKDSIDTENPNVFTVVLGPISTDFAANQQTPDSQIFSVTQTVIDREYDPRNFQSDIGVMQLAGRIRVSDKVRPACFPNRSVANEQVQPGVEAFLPVIQNEELHYQDQVKLVVSEQGECRRECSRTPTITEFCATNTPGSLKLAKSDSGSGLVFSEYSENPKRYYIQGIMTKVADKSERCAKYHSFTSINVFTDWITKVHEELLENNIGISTAEVPVTISPIPVKITTLPPLTTRLTTTTTTTTEPPTTPFSIPESPSTPSGAVIFPEHGMVGLRYHNLYRRRHQSPDVKLSSKLSKEAQTWADYLLRENKWEFTTGKDYSENIFQYFGPVTRTDAVRLAVKNWYDSINKYNWDKPEASTFTQLVWKSSTHIGIGIATRGTKTVVVANYYPKGNVYYLGLGDRAKYFRDNVFPLRDGGEEEEEAK